MKGVVRESERVKVEDTHTHLCVKFENVRVTRQKMEAVSEPSQRLVSLPGSRSHPIAHNRARRRVLAKQMRSE